jgi:hypothetical protein
MIEKSKNQYSSNIIAIVKNTKAPTKALDKALQKHSTKHSQSTASINKQENKKQETSIVVATKVATLEEYIKENFSLEFISDIYKKYDMTKNEFQEECESFVDYRKEKNIN